MTFQFPYNNILTLKEKEKDQAYSEFGIIIKKKAALQEEQNAYIQERDDRISRWEQESFTSVIEIRQRHHFLEGLNEKISKINKDLLKVEEEFKTKQAIFFEKKKDERMWQHLRDKSYDAYIQKEKKEEQDLMDEMAAIRHYHQRLSI
ncbi:flagellar export protein FliJ [Neobacillus sp. 114]|uniref:flagellar export protein FliJ n=1 Tax=Neobacillus sp. 114 TaxID=3048535 RepID=UPI0024C3D9CB|nr:flagellar export protein FliJ [Neobacillus sp. 114]